MIAAKTYFTRNTERAVWKTAKRMCEELSKQIKKENCVFDANKMSSQFSIIEMCYE